MGATELLERAIEAHGGASAFDSASELEIDLRCSGWAFPLKFQRGALAGFTGTVTTTEPRVTIREYGGPGRCGVLEHGQVRIETEEGAVVSARPDPRPQFRRLRRQIWWDDLDLVYFASYALWGYATAPFILRRPGFEIKEAEPWREDGETW